MISLRTKKLALLAAAAFVLPSLAFAASRMTFPAMESMVAMDQDSGTMEPQYHLAADQGRSGSHRDQSNEHQSFDPPQPQSQAVPYGQYNQHNNGNGSGYHKGQKAHSRYLKQGYRVQDWRNRRLPAPPAGYHWVRSDSNEYMLIGNRHGTIYSVVRQDDYREGTTWYNGDRLSSNYRGESHYVTNYRTHRLHRPGRNQRWVKVNNQYLLIGIATGIIIEAVVTGN